MLKLLGKDGLKLMTQLINNIYETGELLTDFNEIAMTALKKKPNATKCSNHHTISLITYSTDSSDDTYKD
jgi:hypothetical protein